MSGPAQRQVRLVARVHGSVQGVGFRWFVLREASGLELTGWTANMADGSVEVVAEGDAESIDRLEAAVRRGPASARVERVEVEEHAPAGRIAGFEIR